MKLTPENKDNINLSIDLLKECNLLENKNRGRVKIATESLMDCLPIDVMPDFFSYNRVPYISTYYIKPIVKLNEEVFINYYITDYWHKEYTRDIYTETFTVTVRVDGQEDKVYTDLKAGDHTVSLGRFSVEGEQKFSILCTDKYGRNSHELFNFFLVQDDIKVKEYVMTEKDLETYNIKNDDNYEERIYVKVDKLLDYTSGTAIQEVANSTIIPSNKYICFIGTTEEDEEGNPIMQSKVGRFWLNTRVKYADDYNKEAVLEEATNTRVGLQKLLDDKKAEGYNKLLLLPGVYRVDHVEPIYVPDEFTFDMNGATIKLNQFTGNSGLILSICNTFNSHIINGIVEGDYFAHDYANSPNNSEWVMGINISCEAKYSSFENLIVKDITGYGGGNGIGGSRDKTLGYTYLYPKAMGNVFKLGDIDRETGLDIESSDRTSSGFVKIEGYEEIGYLAVSKYLGYQGNSSTTWNMIAHFYDESQNFITSIDGYFYRRIKVPTGAKYLRVTILDESTPTDLSIQYFRVPTHCSFSSVTFDNCRCVGLAQAAMNNMLVEDCELTKCGQSSAKCAYDAEDGWDQMQDCTFRRLNFHDNYINDFLTCAGHNFVIEDMVAGKVHFWERTNSYVVRNCKNLNGASLGHGTRKRSGYVRFYNNTSNYSVNISAENDDDSWIGVVKNCTIYGSGVCNPHAGLFIDCNINGYPDWENINNNWNTGLGSGYFKRCSFRDKKGHNSGNGYYDECTFDNIQGSLHGYLKIHNSILNNFNVGAGSYGATYLISNCEINNFQLNYGYWYEGAIAFFDNCNVNTDTYLIRLPHYSMKKPITIKNSEIISNSTNGLIAYYDDRTGGSAGELVKQDMLTLDNNIITMDNSEYVVTGINKNTQNNINITFKDNELLSPNLKLYNEECLQCKNITIVEQ